MAVYNIILYLSMREKTYLYFSACIVFAALLIPFRDNYFSSWLQLNLNLVNQDRYWIGLFILGWIGGTIHYVYSFLQLDRCKLMLNILWWGLHVAIIIPVGLVLISYDFIRFLNMSIIPIECILLGLLIHQAIF